MNGIQAQGRDSLKYILRRVFILRNAIISNRKAVSYDVLRVIRQMR